MTRWQWRLLDYMQIICTSVQTDNHASTYQSVRPDALPAAQPTASMHCNYYTSAKQNECCYPLGRRAAICSNRHGRKVGAVVPLSMGGAGSPSNTISPPGPRPTSVTSGILSIHPFCHNTIMLQTDRIDRHNIVAVAQGRLLLVDSQAAELNKHEAPIHRRFLINSWYWYDNQRLTLI